MFLFVCQARQQTQTRELAELQLKAEREKVESEKQLEETRRRASHAAREAAQTIAQVREVVAACIRGRERWGRA